MHAGMVLSFVSEASFCFKERAPFGPLGDRFVCFFLLGSDLFLEALNKSLEFLDSRWKKLV